MGHTNHSKFHNEKMIANLIQSEDHLRQEYCPECLQKHLLGSESYMEEEVSTNPDANKRLLELAERVREIRREIQEMNEAKHGNMRQKLQSTV